MNQAQRNFLIKKIEDQVKIHIEALKESKPEAPNFNNYLLHKVLSNDFKIKSIESIMETIKDMALNAKQDQNWMTGEKSSWSGNGASVIKIPVKQIFDVDSEYLKKSSEYREATNEIDEKIRVLRVQADTLITRIQLASDKTLDKMINEIDDMGDISLMDTKIRFLNS